MIDQCISEPSASCTRYDRTEGDFVTRFCDPPPGDAWSLRPARWCRYCGSDWELDWPNGTQDLVSSRNRERSLDI